MYTTSKKVHHRRLWRLWLIGEKLEWQCTEEMSKAPYHCALSVKKENGPAPRYQVRGNQDFWFTIQTFPSKQAQGDTLTRFWYFGWSLCMNFAGWLPFDDQHPFPILEAWESTQSCHKIIVSKSLSLKDNSILKVTFTGIYHLRQS